MAFISSPYGGGVDSFIVRVWMPDRPGALGAVASRIGAAGGDVVGIEIIEQGAGRAIDELIVHLPDPSLVNLLINEVSQVDGVDVEEVRPTSAVVHDPRLQALDMAVDLLDAPNREVLLDVLCEEATTLTEAEWTVVLDQSAEVAIVSRGQHPAPAWLAAFVHGSSDEGAADDIISATLVPDELVLVLGRDRADFRTRQRERVAALARIAATRWRELGPRSVSPVARSLDRT